MKYIISVLLIVLVSCNTTKQVVLNNSESCGEYQFGQVAAKRNLKDVDKANLVKHGIHIVEFIDDDVYTAYWRKSITKKQLDKLPISNLVPSKGDAKLGNGMTVDQLRALASKEGQYVVVAQFLSNLPVSEYKPFGVFEKDINGFVKLMVPHNKLEKLLEYPCLRSMTVLKETPFVPEEGVEKKL